jgi:hypothetical protein
MKRWITRISWSWHTHQLVLRTTFRKSRRQAEDQAFPRSRHGARRAGQGQQGHRPDRRTDFKKAKQGEVWAITMLVDRVDGKVPGSFGRVDESSDLAPIARVLRIFGCPRKMSEAEKRRRTPTSTSFERKGARHEGGQPE